jgi:hypothetical protein
MTVSGMTSIVLDSQGHLTQFTAVAPQVDDSNGRAPAADWSHLFEAAGLDHSTFKPVESSWVPIGYADERRAWEGPMPGRSDIQLRVEAASFRGRIAFFQLVGPWTRRPRMGVEGQQGRSVIRFALFLFILILAVGTCVLARHNFGTGRADQRGATRIAIALLSLMFAAWVIGARHWLEPLTEWSHFLDTFAGEQVMNAAILWLMYMALEPYVRRYSPDMLMSWNRLLSGRFRDPRVGRDLLIGIAAGLLTALLACAVTLAPPLFGYPPPPPRPMSTEFLLASRRVVSLLLRMPVDALFNGMIATLVFALARMTVKRTSLAVLITMAVGVFLLTTQANTEQLWINVLYGALVTSVNLFVLVQFGMLPLILMMLTSNMVMRAGLTADLNKLYAPTTIWLMAMVIAAAAFGYYASRAGAPLFGKLET